MTASTFLANLGSTLGGVLSLQGWAFAWAASTSREGVFLGFAIVFLAGLSQALAQSIVLFANRVKPARFIFTGATGAALFLFAYVFLVLSTWAVSRLPWAPHLPLAELAIVFALSYAPLLFSFFGALPYLGPGILTLLRIWHLLAMVVGVAAVAKIGLFAAAAYVAVGWTVMIFAERSFGRPIAVLGARILDAVAGVKLVDDEHLIIGRAVESAQPEENAPARRDADVRPATSPSVWRIAVSLLAVGVLAVVVALALDPIRGTLFGWNAHLPRVLRIPIDLVWLGFVALIVAGIMAPLETLGWWAGWYGDRIDTSDGTVPVDAVAGNAARFGRYAIYLDGISQSSARYTPDIETFLDALAPELPSGVRLIRGLMVYSVMNRPLEEDPLWSRLWSFVDAQRPGGSRAAGESFLRNALGMIINLRNVMIVAVSADPRYGPMYNFGIAYVMYKSLIANGYRPGKGIPVSLIGYSGGAQMACGAAPYLKEAIGAPIDVISLGGVISGDDPLLQLRRLYHLVGDKDMIERMGPAMFPSRWKIMVRSYWNVAKRLGVLIQISLGPVGHQVPGGMLDPDKKLPDGRSSLRQTLDYIEEILAA
ncbi:MAG: hypothetical protein WCB01_03370 [Candidatus Cybelea sp.]